MLVLLIAVLLGQGICEEVGQGISGEVNVTLASKAGKNLSDQQIWTLLREASNSERLHHSDECDPRRQDHVFHKMMNLNRGGITQEIIDHLAKDIKMTCDWNRYMFCETTRKRCVCSANAVWISLEQNEQRQNLSNGTCVLRPKSPCYASKEEHSKDPMNILGINPPYDNHKYAPCAGRDNETRCLNQTCQCLNPTSPECRDLEQIYKSRLRHVIDKTKQFKWAGLDELCTFKSPLIIDTRVDSLRSIELKLRKRKEGNVYVGNICDINLGLECLPKSTEPLATKGRCQCGDRSTWFNGTCHGELGYSCEYNFWVEADTVGLKRPCMPTLTCTRVSNLGVQRSIHVCCFIGLNWARGYMFERRERLFCPLRGQILKSSFFIRFVTTILLVSQF